MTTFVPIEQLPSLLIDYLQKTPRRVHELVKLTGYTDYTVRMHLEILEQDLRAHRTKHGTSERGAGGYFEWHAGPGPAEVARANHVNNRRHEDVHEAFFGSAVRKP